MWVERTQKVLYLSAYVFTLVIAKPIRPSTGGVEEADGTRREAVTLHGKRLYLICTYLYLTYCLYRSIFSYPDGEIRVVCIFVWPDGVPSVSQQDFM